MSRVGWQADPGPQLGRPALVEVSWSVLARLGGGEKVGEQLCDALGRVVMHPVRRAEQALDAVQVGHVIVVRLG